MTATPEPVLPAARRPMPGSPEVAHPAPPPPAPAVKQRSAAEIQHEIAQTRQRLAQTIDELVDRAHPRNVIDRTKRQVKGRVTTPEGSPRPELVGGVLGAVAAIALLVWWTRRRRARRLQR